MRKLTLLLAASVVIAAGLAGPAAAGSFNPLRVARDAAHIGLDTAKRTIDLGIETGQDVAEDIADVVTPDNCRRGTRYKDTQGHWHTCR
jgi:hypothetical protein